MRNKKTKHHGGDTGTRQELLNRSTLLVLMASSTCAYFKSLGGVAHARDSEIQQAGQRTEASEIAHAAHKSRETTIVHVDSQAGQSGQARLITWHLGSHLRQLQAT